jgi:hypothetical protein
LYNSGLYIPEQDFSSGSDNSPIDFPHPKLDPGPTPYDQAPNDPFTTTSVHTRSLAKDIVLDQDWYPYLLKYPDEAVTFENADHPVIRWLVPTLYEINTELRQSPQVPP